jgi:hypothetical protein
VAALPVVNPSRRLADAMPLPRAFADVVFLPVFILMSGYAKNGIFAIFWAVGCVPDKK